MIHRVVLNEHESPLRAALADVLLRTLAALLGCTPRRVRRRLDAAHGVLTIAIVARE